MQKQILWMVLLLLVWRSLPAAAQDANDEMGRYTDLQFNHPKNAVFVNGVFIKSALGLDMGRERGDTYVSKRDCRDSLVINGVAYAGRVDITLADSVEFQTLEEIRQTHCPEVAGPVLYMLNKFFITHDEASYRIEKGFVKHCEVLPSSEIPFFQGQKPFTIVRIFLKTAANTYPMRIGSGLP